MFLAVTNNTRALISLSAFAMESLLKNLKKQVSYLFGRPGISEVEVVNSFFYFSLSQK